jgi:hypothetical protein
MFACQFLAREVHRPFIADLVVRVTPDFPILKETSMREYVRPAVAALSIAGLVSALTLASADNVLAQANQQPPAPGQAVPPPAQPPEIKQIALTDKQIEGVLAAQKEIDAITDKLPNNVQPDQKGLAQLEGIARKYGFSSYAEYSIVVDNIGLVLGGFDPATKKYVGVEAVIKAQIAQVQADKKMSADDKKEALAELNEALKSPPPAVANKANIDLVSKYYDRLAAALGDDQE